ncbi:MAG: glycosyltransferase family 39 protein [Actinomycetota bacterium]|nr:glycosyltransferase family 39 protein [Actinomycetota bacterium]
MATTVETSRASATVDQPAGLPSGPGRIEGLLRYAVPVATGLVVLGLVLRFLIASELWLDESLSVNIARLPLHRIPGALRQDGAPPLYYVLLHYWMLVFGEGNFAVRALSGVASVATLPVAWVAGKRIGGRRLAWATLLLLATSPFAVGYATSARMYSLMILWTLLGFIAVARAIEAPSTSRLACVAVITALELYSHYWGIYIVAITGLWLLIQAKAHLRLRRPGPVPVWAAPEPASPGQAAAEDQPPPDETSMPGLETFSPGPESYSLEPETSSLLPEPGQPGQTGAVIAGRQQAAWSCFVAMLIGCLAFLPWLPSFAFQMLHTGTPWSNAAGLGDILSVLGQYAGGGPWGAALGLSLFTLVLLGVFGESINGRQVLLNLSARRKARPIAFVFMGTLMLAVLCGAVAQAAFVGRYTAVVFPLFILLAGLGVTAFADRRVMAVVLCWTSLSGLIVGLGSNLTARTEAGRVAALINSQASANDVVVYCPDQLGPAAARLITARVQQLTFPRGDRPERINWVDYRQAIHDVNVEQFARTVVAQAAGKDIYFVSNPSYPGTEHKCSQLLDWFGAIRSNGQTLVQANPGRYYEFESVIRYPH